MSSVCSKLRRIWQTSHPKPRPAAASPPPPSAAKPNLRRRRSSATSITNLLKEPNAGVLASTTSPQLRERQRICYYAINRLAQQKRFSSIEDILESQKKHGNIQEEGLAARLMRLYGIARMFSHAHNLFDELPDLNCPRTTMSFNALLGAALHAKEFQRVCEIFREYPSKFGFKVDVQSYNVVMKALAELGLMDEVISMVDEMKEKGLEPNLVTFNAIVGVAYRKGFSIGEKVWKLMVEKIKVGLVLDSKSYTAKLNGMVNEGMVLEAVELVEELRSKGLEPNTFTYNHLIRGFCDVGDVEEAKKWYRRIVESKGLYPNRTTFDTLVKVLCDDGDSDLAFDLSKRVVRAALVDEDGLQMVVDRLVKDSKVGKAEELVKLCKAKYYQQYNLVVPSSV